MLSTAYCLRLLLHPSRIWNRSEQPPPYSLPLHSSISASCKAEKAIVHWHRECVTDSFYGCCNSNKVPVARFPGLHIRSTRPCNSDVIGNILQQEKCIVEPRPRPAVEAGLASSGQGSSVGHQLRRGVKAGSTETKFRNANRIIGVVYLQSRFSDLLSEDHGPGGDTKPAFVQQQPT